MLTEKDLVLARNGMVVDPEDLEGDHMVVVHVGHLVDLTMFAESTIVLYLPAVPAVVKRRRSISWIVPRNVWKWFSM